MYYAFAHSVAGRRFISAQNDERKERLRREHMSSSSLIRAYQEYVFILYFEKKESRLKGSIFFLKEENDRTIPA